MRKSFKALAGVALAAALVVAPLTAGAASAQIGDYDSDHNGYVLALWKSDAKDSYPQTLVNATDSAVQTLVALATVDLEPCTFYKLELYRDDATTDALLAAGTVASANVAKSWPGGTKRFWHTATWKTRCGQAMDTVVTPTLTWTNPSCDAPGVVTSSTEGVSWAAVPNEDGTSTYTATPIEGYAFPQGFDPVFQVPDLDQWPANSELCPAAEDQPVPALFDIEPTPASCDAAGTLDTSVFPIDRPGYVLSIDRPFDGPGEYTITATAKTGFVIQGSVSRVVTVDPQVDRGLCALVIVEAPEPPTFDDQCGTENDGFDVPADTETVAYLVNHENGVVSVNAYPAIEGDSFAEDVVHEWSYTFTDVPCATAVDDPADPADPAAASLAVTGGSTVNPLLPIGAGILVMAGIALAVTRRFAKR